MDRRLSDAVRIKGFDDGQALHRGPPDHHRISPGLIKATPSESVSDDDGGVGVDTITVTIRVPATVDFHPDVLNLRSKGQTVTAYIELPVGYDVNKIKPSTVVLNGKVYVFPKTYDIADYHENAIPDLAVKFDRAAGERVLTTGDHVTVTITGRVEGIEFEGADTIRVTRQCSIRANIPAHPLL